MSGNNQPAGWYDAQGDPPGSVRWWDGSQWVGGPQQQGAQQQDGYVVPGASGIANGRELADPWMRIAAGVIEFILIFIIGLIFSVIGGGSAIALGVFEGGDGLDFADPTLIILALIPALIIAAYHTAMNTYMSGGLGKQILGLRIVRADGTEPLGTPDGVKRSANHILDVLQVIPLVGPIVIGLAQGILNLVSLVFLSLIHI